MERLKRENERLSRLCYPEQGEGPMPWSARLEMMRDVAIHYMNKVQRAREKIDFLSGEDHRGQHEPGPDLHFGGSFPCWPCEMIKALDEPKPEPQQPMFPGDCLICGEPGHRYGTTDPNHEFNAVACVNGLLHKIEKLEGRTESRRGMGPL